MNTEETKILVVSHTATFGGSNQVLLMLLRHCPANITPTVVFLHGGTCEQAVTSLGFETRVIEAGRARQAHRAPLAINRLRQLARRSEIVFNHVSKAQAYGGLAALLARRPSVWYQHELPGSPKFLQKVASSTRPACVIANSDYVAQRHLQIWPEANVVTARPGVCDVDSNLASHTRSAAINVAVLGRLQPQKRVERSIEIFSHLQRELPASKLFIIGDVAEGRDYARNVAYKQELVELSRRLGIDESVVFLGHRSDVPEVLSAMDVLLHLADDEAFGLSVAEALLRGIPAIVSDNGGAKEIVHDGVSGIVVKATDTQSVESQLLRLARDPAIRTRMGSEGRAQVLRDLDEKDCAGRIWQAVTNCVSPATKASQTRFREA